LPQIYGNFLLPDPAIATQFFGGNLELVKLLIFAQVALGGVLILYMDEIVSKWGIGSGVSLFIVAGIAQALVSGIFNWNPPYPGSALGLNVNIPNLGARENLPIGIIFRWDWLLNNIGISNLLTGENLLVVLYQGQVLALLATIVIFLMIVYVESTRIEIPLAHAAVRGARGKFPVKLIYASVLPMILVRSLQSTLEMVGLLLYRSGFTWLGSFNQYNQPVSGLWFYINPINGLTDWVPSLAALSYPGIQLWQIALHVLCDGFILIAGGILFAIFWVETTGMGSSRVAKQIQKSGMQIPGFRRNEQVIEKVVSRYIPKVTVIGGAFVGFLTLLSSLFGILGSVSGTGMLLAVSITYQLYEKLASEQLMEMHPLMRKFLGEE
jgi:preprotein translocase subunit SecY